MADQTYFFYVENPYWRPSYADSIEILLQEIPPYVEKIRKFVANPMNEDYVKGFLEEHNRTYISEICSSENRIFLKEHIEQLEDLEKCDSLEERTKLKIKNLQEATKYAFGKTLSERICNRDFTVELAKKLNRIIGRDLFSNAGNYRVKLAKPAGYNFYYLEPAYIESQMNKLFDDTGKKIKQNVNLHDCIELSAVFFDRFLEIHPFSNGNGRTARILLSIILIKHTYIPISLFSSSFKYSSNSEYLHCLEEAHAYNNHKLLNSLIIESIHRTCYLFLTSLDVQSEDF